MAKTLVSFLLDRTGSMAQYKDDVIGGFNQFLASQREQPGKCRFMLTLFDSQSIDTESFKSINDVPDLTNETYVPRASTPLLDAIGKTIHATDDLKVKVDQTLFVVYTDGLENCSREYTKDAVRVLVKEHEARGWGFLFLGADIDAYQDAASIGVSAGNTVSTSSSEHRHTFAAVADSVTDYRAGNTNYAGALKAEEERQKKSKKGKGATDGTAGARV